MLSTAKITRLIREYTVITLGLLMYVVSINQFVLPAKIVGGGVSGIGALIYYASEGLIQVSTTYLIINVILVIIAFAVMGHNFGFKTIYGILGITLLLRVIPIPDAPHVSDTLMGAIIAGMLAGSGMGIIFTQGGSSGGTDIVAMIALAACSCTATSSS